jgi:hypothetical protein
MKKRSYIIRPNLKTATYLQQYRCYVCGGKIHAKQRYYDGGHGYRAHEHCLKTTNRKAIS